VWARPGPRTAPKAKFKFVVDQGLVGSNPSLFWKSFGLAQSLGQRDGRGQGDIEGPERGFDGDRYRGVAGFADNVGHTGALPAK
jgi:hypothetical protein